MFFSKKKKNIGSQPEPVHDISEPFKCQLAERWAVVQILIDNGIIKDWGEYDRYVVQQLAHVDQVWKKEDVDSTA